VSHQPKLRSRLPVKDGSAKDLRYTGKRSMVRTPLEIPGFG